MVVGPIDTKISDAVMNFQENSYTVSQRVRKLNFKELIIFLLIKDMGTMIYINQSINTHGNGINLWVLHID